MALLVVLLVLWLITAAVVELAFKGLLWLAVIAIILFVGASVVGGIRRSAISKKQ